MVWKLLRRNISVLQLMAYAVANAVGLAILLVSVKFYDDVTAVRDGGGSAADVSGHEYLVLSKPVPLMAAFGGGGASVAFSDDEIAALEAQPWALKVGEFTAARFDITASVDFAGYGMSTAMFFEALPDGFVDVAHEKWSFDPSVPEIPVIIPKDYLALYNFGFASSRDMPQLSEDLLCQVPMRVTLSGNGRRDVLTAKIAGLSSRLNTIAVPASFMAWANSRYGSGGRAAPSRLMVEVGNAGDPAIASWLDDHGIETDSGKLASGRGAYLAKVAAMVIGGVGLVISALSVFILMLSICILMQKNKDKIRDLLHLGYSPGQVARHYYILVCSVDLAVTAFALAVALAAAAVWAAPIEALGFAVASPARVVVTAVLLMAAVSAAACLSVRRMIVRCF